MITTKMRTNHMGERLRTPISVQNQWPMLSKNPSNTSARPDLSDCDVTVLGDEKKKGYNPCVHALSECSAILGKF